MDTKLLSGDIAFNAAFHMQCPLPTSVRYLMMCFCHDQIASICQYAESLGMGPYFSEALLPS